MRALLATFMMGLSFADPIAQAKMVSAYSCRAVCVGVDWSDQTLHSIGSLRRLGATRDEAFDRLSRSCQRSYEKMGIDTAFLIKGGLSMDRHVRTESEGTSAAAVAAVSGWGFTSFAASSASSYSVETTSHLHVNLHLSSITDCQPTRVDDTELVPVYEGDLWVGG